MMNLDTLSRVVSFLVLGFLVSSSFTFGEEGAVTEASHGLALYSQADLKYGPNEPYAHANPNAPKGGTLNLGTLGAFTKLNPFSLKGNAAPGIGGLIFETLMDGSQDGDEAFSQYGLIAEKVSVAVDRLSMTYFLNPKAAFSDGKPLTADDVVFSFNLIKDPAFAPSYRSYYQDVVGVEKVDAHTVRFRFAKYNQELPLIVGQLSILPKHVYGAPGKKFGDDFDEMAVGSGPYVIDSFDRSKHITYKRNPEYWGRDLSVNRGRYNFDKVVCKVFLDPVTRREALKGGVIDVEMISSSKDWALEFNGKFVKMGYMRKATFPHNRVSGMQCYVFNLRKPIFQSIKVRKAISAVFDFEHLNKNLFYNQYVRQRCYFDNNKEMMSRGPAEGRVKEDLLALREKHNDVKAGKLFVPKDAVSRGPYHIGELRNGTTLPHKDRIALANQMLDALGFAYDKEAGARRKGDLVLSFKITLYSQAFERVITPFKENCAKIGVKVTHRLVQPAEFGKRLKAFDFDMMIYPYGQSMSPGNEQRNYWTTKAADTRGSANFIGIRNPAVDEVVERLVEARTRKDLVRHVQVLDRILCANFYVIPHWYINYDRAIYWNRISGPKRYASRSYFVFAGGGNVIDWWWYDAAKAKKLEAARKAGVALK
ncbi:MAG: extracellular solute-binding protein [Planctomycetota bacterium]|jgi:microcin C transport system substrate-binding protein